MAEGSPDDDVKALLPRRRVPWGAVAILSVGVVAAAVAVFLYSRLDQRGLSLRGPGHLVRLAEGGTWAFFSNDGSLVRVADESAERLGVKTGPCERIIGALQGPLYVLDEVTCDPSGSLQDVVIARLRHLGHKFGYWADGLESTGERLDGVLETVEVYAALIDPRMPDPQLVPLYRPLFPDVLEAARREGLPPPVYISVRRNDLAVVRVPRGELQDLLSRPVHVFAGAAASGGWLVRRVEVSESGEGSLRRLLVAPNEPPWPTRLADTTLRVAPDEGAFQDEAPARVQER